MAPISVKNGMASSRSLEITENIWKVRLPRKTGWYQPELDADEAEEQADGAERERGRVADDHADDEPREHQRGHVVRDELDHCSGFS